MCDVDLGYRTEMLIITSQYILMTGVTSFTSPCAIVSSQVPVGGCLIVQFTGAEHA